MILLRVRSCWFLGIGLVDDQKKGGLIGKEVFFNEKQVIDLSQYQQLSECWVCF